MTEKEISLYIQVGKILDKHYAKDIFSESIVEDIMNHLSDEEKPDAEKIVKEVVFNKQLMLERFL